jgi:hypothetical protein
VAYSNAKILAAFQLLNTFRTNAGLGVLTQSTALDAAADGHSNYLGINNDIPVTATQTIDRTAFTGATVAARVSAAGYSGTPTQTQVGFQQVAVDGVQALLSTPFQRIALLQHGLRELGLGFVEPGSTRPASVTPIIYDRLYSSLVAVTAVRSGVQQQAMRTGSGDISVFPTPNATEVPTLMYPETPNPVATELGPWGPEGYPGYAVSLQVPSNQTLQVAAFTLTKVLASGNVPVSVKVLDLNDPIFLRPNGIINWASVVPLTQLEAGATYQAGFIGTATAVGSSTPTPIALVWRFTTRSGFTVSAAVRESAKVVTVTYTSPSGILSTVIAEPNPNCGAGYLPPVRIGQQSVSLLEGSVSPAAGCTVKFTAADVGTGAVDVRTLPVN